MAIEDDGWVQHIVCPDPSPDDLNCKGRTAVMEALTSALPRLPADAAGLIADMVFEPEKDLLLYRFNTAWAPISAEVLTCISDAMHRAM